MQKDTTIDKPSVKSYKSIIKAYNPKNLSEFADLVEQFVEVKTNKLMKAVLFEMSLTSDYELISDWTASLQEIEGQIKMQYCPIHEHERIVKYYECDELSCAGIYCHKCVAEDIHHEHRIYCSRHSDLGVTDQSEIRYMLRESTEEEGENQPRRKAVQKYLCEVCA